MFDKIPNILTAEELLEKAFKRVKKINIKQSGKPVVHNRKKTIISRTTSFTDIIVSNLDKYVKGFPSLDRLPGFYLELIDIKIGKDQLKHSLGAVDWARKTCARIFSSKKRKLSVKNDINTLLRFQNEIYGRISSVVKQVDKHLKNLKNARKIIRKFPDFRDLPTIVIAGYPNVGKSSLLKVLSNAKPKIARYPFTTQDVYIGHMENKEKYITKVYQIIDTPGLLDRPLEKKNKIEKQAIAALRYLADLIVFILDPSETCGYSIKEQKNLLKQVKELFKNKKIIVVENKADLLKEDKTKCLRISCKTGDGIDKLKQIILEKLEVK